MNREFEPEVVLLITIVLTIIGIIFLVFNGIKNQERNEVRWQSMTAHDVCVERYSNREITSVPAECYKFFSK